MCTNIANKANKNLKKYESSFTTKIQNAHVGLCCGKHEQEASKRVSEFPVWDTGLSGASWHSAGSGS